MKRIKEAVDSELVQFFAHKRQEAERIDRSTVVLVDAIADLTLRGGKRIRPFLCWVGYFAVIARSPDPIGTTRQSHSASKQGIASPARRDRNDRLLHAMVGLELFQSFALIHDDIIDHDAIRRGGPSVHAKLGVNMAILAGDLAMVWADEEMNRAGDAVQTLYGQMKEEVMYGQALDVMGEAGTSDVSKERVDELKTAWYSIVRPLQIGSSIALSLRGAQAMRQSHSASKQGIASPARRDRNDIIGLWERWGVPVGKLFQLRDDFLDHAIDDEVFEQKAAVLKEKANRAMGDAVIADEIRGLLVEFIQFVSTRKS